MSQLLPASSSGQECYPGLNFSSLPVELRIRVWEFASFLPRNLDIWSQLLGTLENDQTNRAPIFAAPFRYLTTRPVPAILHINRESRLIGLKHYSLEFGWNMRDEDSGLEMRVAPRIYYNPYVDRVCLMGSYIDPNEHQGSTNEALPWSLYTSGQDQFSLAPASFAVNLWPHEYAYGFDQFDADVLVPAAFGFIIGLKKVKEVLLFWESGLEIDDDNILQDTEIFKFVEVDPDDMGEERGERLEIGKVMFDREFQERRDEVKNELVVGRIDQAEYEQRSAHLKVQPVIRMVRLMSMGQFFPDPGY